MNIEYCDVMGVCFVNWGYSIYRHDPLMCDVPGTYGIITNVELARMQGVTKCHLSAVADDFGNLVAVPVGVLQ